MANSVVVVEQVRTAAYSNLPIMLITDTPKDATPLFVQDNIAAIIAKPFDIDELLACIARLM